MFSDLRRLTLRDTSCRQGNLVACRAKHPLRHPNRLWVHGLRVLIAGAGLGGLCLAQMLRNAGVEVEIFERDASPWERSQGYRLHIDADGASALSQALPDGLQSLFEATSMRALPYTTIVDTNLRLQQRLPIDEYSSTQHHVAKRMATHVNVDRATLRGILLAGLGDICAFNAPIVAYESEPDGVTAILGDGRRVRGDLLVGADGIRSAVRAQRSPAARTADTGVRCIYGRLSITEARRLLPAHALADVFTRRATPGRWSWGWEASFFR
jgi:2-polyprenyl-6-methoxyphenol hydroxylase-like FAD-dependent oxidoreductase